MKFSILVPTMGLREEEIERFFSSLVKQTYKDFEVIIVSQINHLMVREKVAFWSNTLKITQIELDRAGLSYARNQGLLYCSGDWVILSDDDAWYPDDGLKRLSEICTGKYQIVLTQIYDPIKKEYYKKYNTNIVEIINRFQLMSKSSIEIAFKKDGILRKFDEQFGLGAKYSCGEEVDFLLQSFEKKSACYFPTISVFHQKKSGKTTDKQQFAKGALYSKHFGRFIAWLITVRDFIKRRNVDNKMFWLGFDDYRRSKTLL